jgi:tetratricopeptide (TPR) repeat protein
VPENIPSNRYKYLYLFLLLGIFSGTYTVATGSGVPEKLNCKVYNAYINDKMENWEEALVAMTRQYNWERDPAILRDILYAQYGLIGYKIGVGKEKAAKDMLNQAQGYLDKLMEKNPNDSELLALQGAFYAYKISLNKTKAITLGPKSMFYIEKALDENHENPTAWIQKGNAKYYMPKSFGGSVVEAINHYEKAVGLFEQNRKTGCNWMYINTLTYLGKMYAENNQREAALETYEKILSIEPSFGWVKNELLPKIK